MNDFMLNKKGLTTAFHPQRIDWESVASNKMAPLELKGRERMVPWGQYT